MWRPDHRRMTSLALGFAVILGVLVAAIPASAQCQPYRPGYADQPDYYRPYLPRSHRYHSGHGLRYYRYYYPYSKYYYHRRAYPHTYRGQFGLKPRPDRLSLRFQFGPGVSIFNGEVDHHLYGEDPSDYPLTDDADVGPEPLEIPDGNDARNPSPPPRPPLNEVRRGSRTPPEPRPLTGDDRRAWRWLGEDDAVRSQYAFSSLALAYPARGLPKLGYALALARQSDHDNAVFAMRRAFKVDAGSLDRLPLDASLELLLRGLLTEYGEGAEPVLGAADRRFMTAALHYLLNEPVPAREALRQAVGTGDYDLSTLNLLKVILQASEDAEAKPARIDLRV